jgi:hypothetical protein
METPHDPGEQQRCWVHKTANVLNKLPTSQQSKAKRALQEVWMAETKKDALAAFEAFAETWAVKYDKAVACLTTDREPLLAFYDFPAEHWKHLLVGLLGELHAKRIDLYLHQQGLDTTTPAGKAMFQMMGVFAEFERAMIQERVKAGLARARASGKKLGRPTISADVEKAIRKALEAASMASGRSASAQFSA